MNRVLNQDENDHALPYGYQMASIFDAYVFLIKVQNYQTTKDEQGQVAHVALPTYLRCSNTPLQCIKNAVVAKSAELEALQINHQKKMKLFQDQIVALRGELDCERAENIATILLLTQITPPSFLPLVLQNPSTLMQCYRFSLILRYYFILILLLFNGECVLDNECHGYLFAFYLLLLDACFF